MSVLIKNGRIITADSNQLADIFIEGEQISAIGHRLTMKADEVIDATGKLVSYVRTAANITVPEGNAASVTGYISIYQPSGSSTPTAQITLRTSADVVK